MANPTMAFPFFVKPFQGKGNVSTNLQNAESVLGVCLAFLTSSEEIPMSDPVVEKIQTNPKYLELRKKRSSFGWLLTLLMMVVYYGYIALIAFNKPFLAQPIGSGVTTLGIPIGMGVIVFTIMITGIYVRRANSEFDALTTEILKDASK